MKTRNIPFSPPDISELEILSVIETLKSGWITTGPKSKEFESRISSYLGTNKTIAMNSATVCMEMALRVLDIGPGDEVITTAYTYTASASVIDHVGAKIIMIDTLENSFQLNYEQIANAITEKTKAIIPVDIGGSVVDYDRIIRILNQKKNLYTPKKGTLQELFDRVVVIADAAHAFGAKRQDKKVGTLADFTSFSFHAVKNLTTSEGGALTWNNIPNISDEELYSKFSNLILHGQTKDALAKTQVGSWEYDITRTGYKANMTDISAAIGIAQLDRYPKLLERRKEIILRYDSAFKNLPITTLPHFTDEYQSSGHLYLIRIDGYEEEQRNQFIKNMAELGVAVNVHYKPLPLMTAYNKLGFDIKNYPNAYNMYKNEVTLPLHTLLTDEDVDYIISSVIQTLEEGKVN